MGNQTTRAKPKRTNPYRRVTKSGKVKWDAVAYIIPRDPHTGLRAPGPLVPKSKTFDREADAKKWLRKSDDLKEQGLSPVSTKETLGEYLATWLAVHASQVRAVTLASYRGTIKRWILTSLDGGVPLGDRRLVHVTVQDIDQLYREMNARGITREIRYLHGVLKRAFKDAMRKEVLLRNPAEGATIPKANAQGEADAPKTAGRAMSAEQADRFLEAASETDEHGERKERLCALWHVLLRCGLRPSEAFALSWSDIDFNNRQVRIRRSLSRVVDLTKHPAGWAFTLPKTKRSRRTVPLDLAEDTIPELIRWKVRQTAERLKVGASWQDHGLVFTTEWGTPLDLSNLRGGSFLRIMRRAGLGTYFGPVPPKPRSGPTKPQAFKPSFRIYDLRHTFATLALEAGIPLLVVSRWLGHSTVTLTADIYAHILPEKFEGATGCFDRRMRVA